MDRLALQPAIHLVAHPKHGYGRKITNPVPYPSSIVLEFFLIIMFYVVHVVYISIDINFCDRKVPP